MQPARQQSRLLMSPSKGVRGTLQTEMGEISVLGHGLGMLKNSNKMRNLLAVNTKWGTSCWVMNWCATWLPSCLAQEQNLLGDAGVVAEGNSWALWRVCTSDVCASVRHSVQHLYVWTNRRATHALSCVLCVALHIDTNCIMHYGLSGHSKGERYLESTGHISLFMINW